MRQAGEHVGTEGLTLTCLASARLPCPALPCSVRGGDEGGDALHAPSLRLRLLRSLAAVIAAAKVRCPLLMLPSCAGPVWAATP